MKDSIAIDFYSILSERERTYVLNNLHVDKNNKQIERESQVDFLSQYFSNKGFRILSIQFVLIYFSDEYLTF